MRSVVYATVLLIACSFSWAQGASAYFAQGDSYVASGSYNKAREAYEKALRLDGEWKTDARASRNVGLAYLRSTPPDGARAVAALRTAVALDPASQDSRARLAEALVLTGACNEAVNQYRILIAQDSASPDYLLGLADVLSRIGKHDEAISELQRALERRPEWNKVRIEYARLLNFQGRHAEAKAQFAEVLRSDRSNLIAQVGMAKAVSFAGDQETALAMYDAILARHAGLYDANVGKAFALLWSGRVAEATPLLKQAAQRHPEDRDVAAALRDIRSKSVRPPAVRHVTPGPSRAATYPNTNSDKSRVQAPESTPGYSAAPDPAARPHMANWRPTVFFSFALFGGALAIIGVVFRRRARRASAGQAGNQEQRLQTGLEQAGFAEPHDRTVDSELIEAGCGQLEHEPVRVAPGTASSHESDSRECDEHAAVATMASDLQPVMVVIGGTRRATERHSTGVKVVCFSEWPPAVAYLLSHAPQVIVLRSCTQDGWTVTRMAQWFRKNLPACLPRLVISPDRRA